MRLPRNHFCRWGMSYALSACSDGRAGRVYGEPVQARVSRGTRHLAGSHGLIAVEGVTEVCRFSKSLTDVTLGCSPVRAGREVCRGTSYARSLSSRREWTMLCRIRNASDCSVSVRPASILASTDRTAALAFSRLRRPRGVSRVGSTFPTGAAKAWSRSRLVPGPGAARSSSAVSRTRPARARSSTSLVVAPAARGRSSASRSSRAAVALPPWPRAARSTLL